MKSKLYLTLAAILFAGTISAQTQHLKIDPEFSPQVYITGTSSLHDWKVTGSGILEVPQELDMTPNHESGIPNFSFKVPVDSLDGGRGSSMNNKILTAFNAAENPYITYQQTAPAQVQQNAGSPNLTVTSTGNLSMAGVQKTINVSVQGQVENGQVIFKGSKPLKITDYAMTPPSAMFGQIKTHDDVVVHFEFRYRVTP